MDFIAYFLKQLILPQLILQLKLKNVTQERVMSNGEIIFNEEIAYW